MTYRPTETETPTPCSHIDAHSRHYPFLHRATLTRSGHTWATAFSPESRLRLPESPGRVQTAGKPRPRLHLQPAVPTRREAPDTAPTSAGRKIWVPRTSDLSHPGGARHLPAPFPFSPLRAARGHLSILQVPGGKSSQRRESSKPALALSRQAGACSRRHTRRQTRRDTGTHAGGTLRPRECGSIRDRAPCWGGFCLVWREAPS